jgi:hypothetical protein
VGHPSTWVTKRTLAPQDEFFRLYEQANRDFDVQLMAKLYADTFMFGNPQGVQAVKKEDFVKALPRRKEFMKTAGPIVFACRFCTRFHAGFQVRLGEDRLEYELSGHQRR